MSDYEKDRIDAATDRIDATADMAKERYYEGNAAGTTAGLDNDRIDALYRSTVVDASGDRIGGVGQVYLDDVTNQPTWVTVNTGFLGLKESFIPMDKASFEGDTIRVPFEKEFIKNAPAVDPDGHIDEAQEQELYAYYNMHSTTATHGTTTTEHVADVDRTHDTHAVADTHREDLDGETVLREERVNVGTEKVEAGRARLRKHVVTETKTIEVPVTREELVVERVPLNGEHVDNRPLAEGETEVVLHEERPVISKETVATEKVQLGTREVTETHQANVEVGKEQVEVVQDANLHTNREGLAGDRHESLGDKIRDGVEDVKDGIARKTDGNPNT